MGKGYESRNLLEFQNEFPDAEACYSHLVRQRWAEGWTCPACGNGASWFLAKRRLFDCKACRKQTSVTAGTIFHKSRVPLLKWYWLIYHMATEKVGVSVAQMQRTLDIRDYKTAWLMAHKIRKGMADRDAGYHLAGLVEMDETFFGPRGKTQGRGSESKVTVLCAVSLFQDKDGRQKPGFAHMRVVPDASAQSIEDFLQRLGSPPSSPEGRRLLKTIRTDGWRSYGRAAKNKGLGHLKVALIEPADAGKLLPWVHRVISNSKAVIRGAHRGVSEKHLQAYLSEICYRFNRRYWERELFDRLVKACLSTQTVTYRDLIKETAANAIRS
jgi:transposase-like protein